MSVSITVSVSITSEQDRTPQVYTDIDRLMRWADALPTLANCGKKIVFLVGENSCDRTSSLLQSYAERDDRVEVWDDSVKGEEDEGEHSIFIVVDSD